MSKRGEGSQKSEGKLRMVADPQKEDSVFDFLYVDHDRIGLLLSQFSNDGILTEIVRQSEEGDESDWGMDLKLVKVGSKESGRKSLNRRFNTRWLLPLLFLDKTQIRFKTPEEASLGDLTRTKGVLSLLNTELLQDLYQTEALRNVAMKKARAQAKQNQSDFDMDAARIELEALGRLPAQVQMHLFRGESLRLWSTLRPDGLITPASELTIKHGNIIPGEWNVIGIVDAYPVDATAAIESERLLLGRFDGQAFLQESIQITNGLRTAYGRAPDSLGITALLIFRQIG